MSVERYCDCINISLCECVYECVCERAKSYVYFGSGNISQNVSFVAISTLNDTGDTL